MDADPQRKKISGTPMVHNGTVDDASGLAFELDQDRVCLNLSDVLAREMMSRMAPSPHFAGGASCCRTSAGPDFTVRSGSA